MTVPALPFGPVRSVCAPCVLVVRHEAKVVDVHTPTVLADMVNGHAIGDLPVNMHPRGAMRGSSPSPLSRRLPSDLRIAMRRNRIQTDTAAVGRIDAAIMRPLRHMLRYQNGGHPCPFQVDQISLTSKCVAGQRCPQRCSAMILPRRGMPSLMWLPRLSMTLPPYTLP